MPRTKVTFPPNIPTQVILAGAGVQQNNAQGEPEYRYFLHPDSIMWAPIELHTAIQQTGAEDGDTLEICKSQAKRGAPIRWDVRPAHVTPRAGNGYHAPQPQPPAPPVAQAAPPAAPPRPAPQQRQQPTAELPVAPADHMAAALKDAVDLLIAAAAYAAEQHNWRLSWDMGDARALAATLFIQQQQQQRGGRPC